MHQDILNIRAGNSKSFFKNNIISKSELEKQVQPYLKKYNMTFQEFLREDTIKSISKRKKKQRAEKIQIISMVIIMIFGLYAVGQNEAEVREAQYLSYNYR